MIRRNKGLKNKIKHLLYKTSEGFVVIIIFSVAIFCLGVLKVNALQVKLALADQAQAKIEGLKWEKQQVLEDKRKVEEEKELLKEKLANSANTKIDDKTKQLVLFYIRKYFADDYDRAVKVFTCESGLDNKRFNVNSKGQYKGTIDRGVAQINDYFHAKRFESMNPGITFEIGAHDIDMNLKYARFLYDHSKWNPWVCRYVLQ